MLQDLIAGFREFKRRRKAVENAVTIYEHIKGRRARRLLSSVDFVDEDGYVVRVATGWKTCVHYLVHHNGTTDQDHNGQRRLTYPEVS
jgi:hypothetical protein